MNTDEALNKAITAINRYREYTKDADEYVCTCNGHTRLPWNSCQAERVLRGVENELSEVFSEKEMNVEQAYEESRKHLDEIKEAFEGTNIRPLIFFADTRQYENAKIQAEKRGLPPKEAVGEVIDFALDFTAMIIDEYPEWFNEIRGKENNE